VIFIDHPCEGENADNYERENLPVDLGVFPAEKSCREKPCTAKEIAKMRDFIEVWYGGSFFGFMWLARKIPEKGPPYDKCGEPECVRAWQGDHLKTYEDMSLRPA